MIRWKGWRKYWVVSSPMLRISFSLVLTRFATCILSAHWTALRAIFGRFTTGLSNSIHDNVALCLPTVRDHMECCPITFRHIFPAAPFCCWDIESPLCNLEFIPGPDSLSCLRQSREKEYRQCISRADDKSGGSSFIIQWGAHLPYIYSPAA